MINWTLFAERVPLNTRVRATENVLYVDDQGAIDMKAGQEGLLIRYGYEGHNWMEAAPTWFDGFIVQFFDHLTEKRIAPHHLQFLIEGRWYTSKEVQS